MDASGQPLDVQPSTYGNLERAQSWAELAPYADELQWTRTALSGA